MQTTRREFLKQIGIGAASLASAWMLSSCKAADLPARAALTPTSNFQLPTATLPAPTLAPPPITARLSADVSRVVGACDSKMWANIGFDPMYSHTVSPATQPVWDLIRTNKLFRYIRCHNTFSDAAPNARPDQIYGCRVYSEDATGKSRYNFQYLDQVLDTWTRAGLKPILEMGFMPDALAEGALVRNYSGGAVNTPRDYTKWRELIHQTVKHLLARYGADEIRTWYFEIWNEPDLRTYFIDGHQPPLPGKFTSESVARFMKMYDYFVDGALAADSQIKVGGPGLAGNNEFFKLFLDHITRGTNAVTGARGTRADFISWHGYGASQSLLDNNRKRRALVRSYPELAPAELHQNEWGPALNLTDRGQSATVLGEYYAAFLCRSIDNNFNNADARVDLILRWGQMADGWRAHTRHYGEQVVPLPIFNAYLLLNKLGPERIAVEHAQAGANVRAFAARRGAPSAQIVVYRLEEKNEDGTGDAVGVELTVSGLSGATLPVKHYRIDRERANAYRAWLALGSPKQPTRAQIDEIAARANLAPETEIVKIENGAARLAFGILPNAMSLLALGEE